MLWHKAALACITVFCLASLGLAAIRSGAYFSNYRRDVEYNEKYCAAEEHAEKHYDSKDFQSFLYRTFDDPVALFTAILTIATIALFIATFGLYAAAVRQGVEAKVAIEAAKRSADIAREILVASNRAWIKINTITAQADLTFHRGGGCSLPTKVHITSIGKEPALNINIYIEMIGSISGYPNPIDTYVLPKCEEVRIIEMRPSFSLLPNDSLPPDERGGYTHGTGLTQDDLEEAVHHVTDHPLVPDGDYIIPFIFGCVSYRTPSDPDKIYQTRFLYEVQRKDGLSIDAWKNVPASDLVLSDQSYDLSSVAD